MELLVATVEQGSLSAAGRKLGFLWPPSAEKSLISNCICERSF